MDSKLLKACMILNGDETCPNALAEILSVSTSSARNKIKGKSDWKMSEVLKFKEYYNLSWEEVGTIFDEKNNDCKGMCRSTRNLATND